MSTLAKTERVRDADRTRAELLAVATQVFAEDGYSGARVDEIAERTRTTKRMIYYYFGGKEQLYIAVLERAYSAIRALEKQVDVEHLEPEEALRQLAALTFDHHEANPDFIRLVSIENIHHGEHMSKSATLRNLNSPAIELIRRILERGYASGAFRRRVEAIDLHVIISSFCVFRIANRHTFGALFDHDLTAPELRETYRRMLGDMVVGYLTGDPAD